MRAYASLSPMFWTRGSGKRLRGQKEAQLVALYLMSSPATSMVGIFHLALPTLCHETGLSLEEASKGLARCSEEGLVFWDEDEELVFVPALAKHQMGDKLDPKDHKVKGVVRALAPFKGHRFFGMFMDRYADPYSLPIEADEGASESRPRDDVPDPDPAPVPGLVQVPDPGSGNSDAGARGADMAPAVARGLVPARKPAPTNQQDALAIPIAERARLVLEDPGNGQWSEPQRWPEVVAVAESLAHAAGNRARPRLGGPSGDSGTKRVLQLLADGWPPLELVTLAAAVGRSKWWHEGGVKGLSSLTPEVLRRIQNESPRRGDPQMDPEIAREIAKTKAMAAQIGNGGT